MPSGINWQQVRADFSDTNNAMRTGIGAISQAGTVFGELRKSILDQEQREIDNAYREKTFNENVRQFGLEYALNKDKFDEDVRQFGLTHRLNEDRFNEMKRQFDTQLKFDREKWGYAKQQQEEDRANLKKLGDLFSGKTDDERNAVFREARKADYSRLATYKEGIAQTDAQLAANDKAMAEASERVQAAVNPQSFTPTPEIQDLQKAHPNIDIEIKDAESRLDRMQRDYTEGVAKPRLLGGFNKQEKEEARNSLNAFSAKVDELRGIRDTIKAGSTPPPPMVGPVVSDDMRMLAGARENIMQQRQNLVQEYNRLNANLEAEAPKSLRAEAFAHPSNFIGAIMQYAPSLAPQAIQFMQNELNNTAKSVEKEADRAFQLKLQNMKIDAQKKLKLLEKRTSLAAEINKLGLQSNYAPYFRRIAQNALLYAAENDINIAPAEIVALLQQELHVEEETIGNAKETNSGRWFSRDISALEEQSRLPLTRDVPDDQLRAIVNHLDEQKLIQERRKQKSK